jgi:hypothetical protein
VNGNTVVKVSLGGSHLDGDTKALQNFITALTKNVQTDNLLVGTFTDNLVGGGPLVILLHHGVVHGGEAGSVDLDRIAKLLASLGLGETDASDGGVREDDGWHVGVVEVGVVLASEQAVPKTTSSSDGDRSQFDAGVADVAESVNALDVCVLVLVDLDVVLVVELNTGVFQVELLNLGSAANGPEDRVDFHGALTLVVLVVQLLDAVAQILELALRAVLVDVETLTLVLFHNLVLDHGVKSAQELVVADEQVGFGAEMVEHASHLDSNVSGTDDGDLLGLLLQVEEAVAADTELSTLDFNGAGTTSNSDQNLVCADVLLLAILTNNLDDMLGDERGGAVQVLDLVVVEVLFVDSVQALHVSVTLVLEGGPVKGGGFLDREAVVLGLLDGLGDGGGVPGDLFGHASVVVVRSWLSWLKYKTKIYIPNVDTSSSQSRVLDGNGLLAVHAASPSGSSETTAANAEDKKVAFFGGRSHDCVSGGKVAGYRQESRRGRRDAREDPWGGGAAEKTHITIILYSTSSDDDGGGGGGNGKEG